MRIFSRLISGVWLLVPVSALGFLVWVNAVHVKRIDHLSKLPGWAEATGVIDPASPTGYANRRRELILPQRNEDSFHWIAQTEQMFARGEWRIRHTDYDNAPAGRAVHQASPYRWWLGTVAWVDHLVSGRPIGMSIERAAVVAQPILHGLFLIVATAFVAWRFGPFAACLVSVGLAGLFPFAAGFLPGIPDDHGLARIGALAGVLALLAGVGSTAGGAKPAQPSRTSPAARCWFGVAGVLGGLGMWVSVSIGVPVIAGISLGALLAAVIARQHAKAVPDQAIPPAPWRTWGLAGGATVMAAFLVEYPPAQLLSWRLESVHPLYSVAWIGAAELLARLTNWIQLGGRPSGWRDAGAIVLGVLAVAGVPVVMMVTESQGFLSRDLLWSRLTNQPDGAVAASLRDWLVRDGFSARAVTSLLPLLALVPAAWSLCRKTTPLATRVSLAITVAPVLIALGFAGLQLGWWNSLGALLLALVVAAASDRPTHRSLQWVWTATVAAFLIPGAMQLRPAPPMQHGDKPASHEAELLIEQDEAELFIERDLAHWLARHAGEGESPVVYAPPALTTTLCFYGGLRGIGTLSPDNQEGLKATIAIAAVTSIGEAQVLLEGRQVRYIVVPSWDPFFDEYARVYLANNWESIFIPSLRQWNLPAWLRPLPYRIPEIPGFEKQSVLVFEVVDEQNPAVAMSRMAECLIEIGEREKAAAAGEALRRYPWDVGALAARAQVAFERRDQAAISQALESLHTRLSSGADRFLPWDRRVSLAIVLARAKRADLARKQVERCLADLDAKKLRSLSTGSLHVLLSLCNAFDFEIADPSLRQLALSLLPPDLRQHHRRRPHTEAGSMQSEVTTKHTKYTKRIPSEKDRFSLSSLFGDTVEYRRSLPNFIISCDSCFSWCLHRGRGECPHLDLRRRQQPAVGFPDAIRFPSDPWLKARCECSAPFSCPFRSGRRPFYEIARVRSQPDAPRPESPFTRCVPYSCDRRSPATCATLRTLRCPPSPPGMNRAQTPRSVAYPVSSHDTSSPSPVSRDTGRLQPDFAVSGGIRLA